MSEFIKGPWVSGYGEGITGPTTPNCSGPCVAGSNYPYDVVSKSTQTIAIIPMPCFTDGEMKANTDLIAAAPDMYEALKECMSLFALGANAVSKKGINFEEKRGKAREIERKVLNAIAKAEGTQNE